MRLHRNCCGIDPWQPSQKLFRIPRQSRSGVRGIFQYRKDSPPCSPQPRISYSNSSSKLLLLKLTPAFFDISNLDSQGLGLHGSGLLHSCPRIQPGPVLEGLRLHSVPGCLLLQLMGFAASLWQDVCCFHGCPKTAWTVPSWPFEETYALARAHKDVALLI